MNPIGPEIAKIRKAKKITPAQLCKKLKITKAELTALEKAVQPPKKQITAVCKVLDIDKSFLAFKCITGQDVDPKKSEAFKLLAPLINNLIDDVIKK